jgi:hypothetical protein
MVSNGNLGSGRGTSVPVAKQEAMDALWKEFGAQASKINADANSRVIASVEMGYRGPRIVVRLKSKRR